MQTLQEINDAVTKTPKGWHHTYLTDYYENLFSKFRNEKFNILEIGIDKGQSLELWSLYFPNAVIYGMDKANNNYQQSNSRIKVIYGSSTNKQSFSGLPNFKFIIDDGSHKLQNQLATFWNAWSFLEQDGYYIIEDIKDIDSSRNEFEKLNTNCKIFDLRSKKNIYDSVIVEIQK